MSKKEDLFLHSKHFMQKRKGRFLTADEEKELREAIEIMDKAGAIEEGLMQLAQMKWDYEDPRAKIKGFTD